MPKKDTKFKKGQSGNPSGRPKLPDDIRQAQKLTTQEFIKIINKYFFMSRKEIQEELAKPGVTMLEILIGSILARAAKDSDHMRATFLLDRVIGKVSDKLNIEMPMPFIIRKRDGEEIIMGVEPKKDDDDGTK